jgi:trk system potassium uptake protein TrkH
LLVGFLAAGEPSDTALWRAVFTSVSAFCNAGFALQTDNLIPYQTNPLVLHTVAALITLGGLSPAVALAAPRWLRRQKTTPISVQAKLALVASLVLAVVGAIFFLAAEWSGSLAHLSFGDRLHNAWFHSVTLRTAGFNSVDMLALSPATVAMSLPWMFIGGSPGGTAGGVKTTTAAILLLAVIAAVTGRDRVVAGGRTIPHRTVYKAAAITTVGAATVFVAFVALLLTQTMPWHVAIFEVVSATGTVGLTIGGTPALDDIGKLVVMACMFAGRVGPLTLFMFVSQRTRRAVWERPEEDLDVG